MGIKTQKVLRLISKIILILVGVGLVGIAGYYVYKSIAFKPQNVVVTNITDGSATVTWTTTSPMKGIVYVKKDKGLLPGPLGIVGSTMAYDDRDVSDAQKACVDAFNKTASETKDSTFSVSGENFDCENIKVTKMGSYYTHSVTMTNLDENSTYNFVVGDGIWSFKGSVSTVKTFGVLDTVGEPMPIFGKVVGDDGTYSRDAIVYITFNDGSESKDSIVYSSAVNDEGGWYLDASAIRDVEGNVLPLEVTNDTFRVKGIYSNYGVSDEQQFIYGFFEVTTFDISIKKTQPVSSYIWDKLVMGAYAGCGKNTSTSSTPVKDAQGNVLPTGSYICSTDTGWKAATAADLAAESSTIGAGNVLKVAAAENGGVVPQSVLNALKVSTAEAKYITSQQSSVAYCDGTSYCSNGSCDANSSKCGGGSTAPSCSPSSCTPTGTSSSVQCVNGKVQSFSNSICMSTTSTGIPGPSEANGEVSKTCPDGTPVNSCKPLSDHSSHYCQANGTFGEIVNTNTCIRKKTNPASTEEPTDVAECTVIPDLSEEKVLKSCVLSCGAGAEQVKLGKKQCISVAGSPEITENFRVNTWSIPIDSPEILEILRKKTEFKKYWETKVSELEEEYSKAKCTADDSDYQKALEEAKRYCVDVLGKKGVKVDCPSDNECVLGTPKKSCEIKGCSDIGEVESSLPSIVQQTYAEEAEDGGYAMYLPEYGMFSFELGTYELATRTMDGKTYNLFYIESNGVDGIQIPEDMANPTSEEDLVLESNVFDINYKKVATAQQYAIKKGINIISFNFVPVSTDSGAYTAKDVISQASTNGVEVQYISTFDGGRWNSGYSCSSGTCTGNNFTIVPGKGYLVYATQDGTVTIPGYNLTSSVPVAFSAGWNLVGVHGYTTAYTARSFIDSINTVEGLTANNVSWWPTSKSKYEGLQVDGSMEYGLDFSMSPNNGYFVRISKFAPTDTKCKSLIWNAGGSLNGTCGNTK